MLPVENNQRGIVKLEQFYVLNACYNLRVALLLHRKITANKKHQFSEQQHNCYPLMPNRENWTICKKVQLMLMKLFQSLCLLCQCFNCTSLESLFYHLSCMQLLRLGREQHLLYFSTLRCGLTPGGSSAPHSCLPRWDQRCAQMKFL